MVGYNMFALHNEHLYDILVGLHDRDLMWLHNRLVEMREYNIKRYGIYPMCKFNSIMERRDPDEIAQMVFTGVAEFVGIDLIFNSDNEFFLYEDSPWGDSVRSAHFVRDLIDIGGLVRYLASEEFDSDELFDSDDGYVKEFLNNFYSEVEFWEGPH